MAKPKKTPKPAPRAKPASDKVAAREAAFIEAMVATNGDKRKSAVAAGYKPGRAADKAGERLSKKVAVCTEIARRRAAVLAEAEEKTGVTVAGVLTELRALVHSDLRRAFDPKSGELLPPHLWPDDLARAMCSVKVVEKEIVTGRGAKRKLTIVPMYVKEVKLWDKGSSMERAMKHLGMFKQDNAQRGDAAIRALMEAVSERSDGFEVRS